MADNIFMDVLTGGNDKNHKYEDARYNIQSLFNEAEVDFKLQSGQISAEEAERLKSDLAAQNDADHEANTKAINFQSGVNAAINIASGVITIGTAGMGIKGLAQQGKATTKMAQEAAEAAARKGTKEIAEDAIGKGTKAVMKEAAEKATKEGAEEALQVTVKKVTKESAESFVEKGAKKTITNVVKETGEELAEKGAKKAVKETVEELAEKGVKDTAKKAAKETLEEAAEKGLKEVGSEVAEKTAKKGLKGVWGDAAASLLEEAGVKAGQVTALDGTQYVAKEVTTVVRDKLGRAVLDKNGKAMVQKQMKVVVDVAGTFKLAVAGVGDAYKGTKGVLSFLKNTGKAAGQVAVGSMRVSGALGVKLMGNGVRSKGINLLGKGLGLGIVTAPMIAGQIATRHMSKELGDRLNDSITLLSDGYDYYTECKDNLTKEQQEYFENLMSGYDKDCADLIEKYDAYIDDEGNITDPAALEAYNEEYVAIGEKYAADLEKEQADWVGFSEYATTDGIAATMAKSAAINDIDIYKSQKYSTAIKDIVGSDSFGKQEERYNRVMEINDKLKDDGFWGFLDKIHDTIVHYAPPVAYAEAAIKKGLDVVLTALPIIPHEEKYKHQGIDDIAKNIIKDSESDYELRSERKELLKLIDDDAVTSVEAWRNREEADISEYAEKGEAEADTKAEPEAT